MMSRRERVLACVEVVDAITPCHLWIGPDSRDGRGGYSRMWLDGQMVAVHKVPWTNDNGLIPGKKELDHLCRMRRCVREGHLELVQ